MCACVSTCRNREMCNNFDNIFFSRNILFYAVLEGKNLFFFSTLCVLPFVWQIKNCFLFVCVVFSASSFDAAIFHTAVIFFFSIYLFRVRGISLSFPFYSARFLLDGSVSIYIFIYGQDAFNL